MVLFFLSACGFCHPRAVAAQRRASGDIFRRGEANSVFTPRTAVLKEIVYVQRASSKDGALFLSACGFCHPRAVAAQRRASGDIFRRGEANSVCTPRTAVLQEIIYVQRASSKDDALFLSACGFCHPRAGTFASAAGGRFSEQ